MIYKSTNEQVVQFAPEWWFSFVRNNQHKKGWRKELSNGTSTFGIDICYLDNQKEAQNVAKIKTNNCSISNKIYNLKDQNIDQFVKTEWD
ncbi:MAG: hypothetical protein DRI70_07420, partial [Bacteroidetes bacterium]